VIGSRSAIGEVARIVRWTGRLGGTYRGLLTGLELVVDHQAKRGSDELGALVTKRWLELGLHMNIVLLPGMGGVSGSPRYWVAGRLAGGWLGVGLGAGADATGPLARHRWFHPLGPVSVVWRGHPAPSRQQRSKQ